MKKEKLDITLSVIGGYKIQQAHLAKWEKVLKPDVMAELREYAEKDNDFAKTGYDICRGNDLLAFVLNYSTK